MSRAPSVQIETSPPTAAVPRPHIFAPLPFAALLALAECAVAGLAFAVTIPSLGWLVCHLVLVALSCAVLSRQRAFISDTGPHVLAVIATLAAGPLGAILAVGAVAVMARERTHPELLTAWYDRIALSGDVDAVTGLYNTVAMGRGVLTSTTPPPVFEYVMRDGSLEDRQTALGLIARRFLPSYAPALSLALVSPEPVIRVQAAAVAVKVRAELKTTLAQVLAQASRPDLSPTETVDCATRLDGIARSGLLEDEDRDRGLATLQTLLAAASTDVVPVRHGEAQPDAATQALLETQLLRQGDFATLRAVRGQSTETSASSRGALTHG
jgi:hypothetical protein